MDIFEAGRENLWQAWPIAGPWRLFPLVGGTNSLVWGAEAADGQVFVLRIIPDVTQVPRLHYESKLLEALHNQGLLFLLPIPLKTRSGDSVVSFAREDGTTALATLCPLLPGRLTDREDRTIGMTIRAASALAILDRAFASLPEIQTPPDFHPLPTFGDLAHWHPLVPDPLMAVERLPIPADQARQIRDFLTTVLKGVPNLYNRLPQQLLHRDYDSSNILMNDERVTAVLDFEFASRDIRILDLCVSISWWPITLFGTGHEWAVIDAFGKTYTSNYPLSEDELSAIPAVWRLRDATSLVNRIGRYFAGQETDTRIQNRIKHSLWREQWLAAHQNTLLQHALQWQ